VRMDKGDFIGRDALASAREHGLHRRLACVVLDDPRAVTLGSEPVRVNGEVKGRVTSGGYGYAVGRSIAYAYLPAELAEPGTGVEVEVFGDWVAGQVTPEPLYDPRGERIRA
jgi:glycine cleavage system aminomethyltransferase T